MIFAFIDHDRGKMNKASLEMVTMARTLDDLLTAVLIGDDAAPLADDLGAYGVQQAIVASHEGLDDYAPEAWAEVIVGLVTDHQPQAVTAVGSERGNEVMAYVAAKLEAPLAANCTEVQVGDSYQVTRVRWGGSLLEEASLAGKPKLFTVAPHVIAAAEVDSPAPVTVETVTPTVSEKAFRVRVNRRELPEGDKVSLTDARVVVSGGRGVGSAEGFESLDELAHLLGGAVGCSRAVTNHGWRPHADQVGQTGARVAPDLYIACGISGAIQHVVGCKGSKHILVVNTDPEAPILSRADYAVIGDLHEVIPAVVEEVRKLQGG